MQSGRNTVLTGFSSDLRFASQSPPANFKAAKRRSVFRLDRTMPAVQKAEALAHFSYQVSQKKILLVDIQGIGFRLCNLEIASADLMSHEKDGDNLIFCLGNLSHCAIDKFF